MQQTNQKFGMTPDAFLVQERFSISNPNFAPFQPNGSGNGRMLEMMTNAIWFEQPTGATLFGGVPFEWLRMNGTTALRRLHTTRGPISIDAQMAGANCRVQLAADSAGTMPEQLRVPEHFEISEVIGGDRDGLFVNVHEDARRVTLLLADAERQVSDELISLRSS